MYTFDNYLISIITILSAITGLFLVYVAAGGYIHDEFKIGWRITLWCIFLSGYVGSKIAYGVLTIIAIILLVYLPISNLLGFSILKLLKFDNSLFDFSRVSKKTLSIVLLVGLIKFGYINKYNNFNTFIKDTCTSINNTSTDIQNTVTNIKNSINNVVK